MCDPSSVAVGDTCLGGAMNDAASGHGFCPQWQKPQFAVRAHHTVVMRITRGSPPRGKAFVTRLVEVQINRSLAKIFSLEKIMAKEERQA